MSKKYWHNESVYVVYNKENELLGIIGFSEVSHEDSEDTKFVSYKIYHKPQINDDSYVLLSRGELRWDGFILGDYNRDIILKGMDELSKSILLQLSPYIIANKEIYMDMIDDHISNKNLYKDLLDLYDKYIIYRNYESVETLPDNVSRLCNEVKQKLTGMSNTAIAMMEKR